jgi:hypothetical protein
MPAIKGRMKRPRRWMALVLLRSGAEYLRLGSACKAEVPSTALERASVASGRRTYVIEVAGAGAAAGGESSANVQRATIRQRDRG